MFDTPDPRVEEWRLEEDRSIEDDPRTDVKEAGPQMVLMLAIAAATGRRRPSNQRRS